MKSFYSLTAFLLLAFFSFGQTNSIIDGEVSSSTVNDIVKKDRDNKAPAFISDCEDQFFCSYEEDCRDTKITLNARATDNLTAKKELDFEYEIDLGNDGVVNYKSVGNDASSDYPFGTHKITWFVKDHSGNTNSCEYLFTVSDCKAPNSYCINGRAVDLKAEVNEIEVEAKDFDLGSFDNCRIVDFLIVSPSQGKGQTAPPTNAAATHVFDCDDLGTQSVDLWVSDAFGNWDYCSTYVVIMGVSNSCPLKEETQIAVEEIVENLQIENPVKVNFNEEIKIYQNTPNPFITETLISFELLEEGKLIFTIQDVSGKILKDLEIEAVQGRNEILIDKKDLNGPGIYFYTIKTKTQKISERIILIQS